jgi:hypothetical protein
LECDDGIVGCVAVLGREGRGGDVGFGVIGTAANKELHAGCWTFFSVLIVSWRFLLF